MVACTLTEVCMGENLHKHNRAKDEEPCIGHQKDLRHRALWVAVVMRMGIERAQGLCSRTELQRTMSSFVLFLKRHGKQMNKHFILLGELDLRKTHQARVGREHSP
jgi:hypothetical protein